MKPILSFLFFAALAAFGQALETRDAHYRLQAEDKIEVLYRYTPEFNATVAVQPDGYVSLPLIGEVKAAGLTLEEAAAQVRAKAGERLADPDVTVVLKDYVKPYFVVSGEVGHPGRFDMHGKVSLIEAIAIGGGVKDSGKRTQVVLVHKTGGDMAEVRVLDLRKLMSPSSVLEDVEVRTGDLIVVPRNALSRVEPYVRMSETALVSILLGIK
jgi:polysaccharide biosynthesis/export protein